MSSAVCISASFLTGRYHGEEWPPSPGRLLQALVAGVKTGGYRALWPRVEAGLRWLENRPAPAIFARPIKELTPYRIAVPNNDFDFVARAWAAGRPANPADLRTMKDVSPKCVAAPEPHLRYIWPLGEAEDESVISLLEPLTRCLYGLGWGVDMAYANVELLEPCADGYEEWLPSTTGGKMYSVPVPGFLADLESTYARFRRRNETMDTDTRPTVYKPQPYQVREQMGFRNIVFTLLAADGTRGRGVSWHDVMTVAAWFRHASAAVLKDSPDIDIGAFVLGHTEDSPDQSHRLSFVPLSSIGHDHADGRIRRVMIVEPPTGDGKVVDRLAARLRGVSLTKEGGTVVGTLGADDRSGVTWLYQRPGRRWRSVTPVILHGFNSSHGRISLGKTESLLRRAFEFAGFDPRLVEQVGFQQAPLWPGAGGAGQIRVPKHLRNYPRYHVEVVFKRSVAGPVLAGIGRHYGIGTFAAVE
jgi:CRISPR-associated protein Csb2